jgi:hypothetical protein
MLRGAVRAGLELFLEQELEALIGAEWYARVDGRRDHRNGRYGRQVLTSLGRVEVAVPRARTGRAPRAVLQRYQRRSPDIDALLTNAYVHGVSTRQAGELTMALFRRTRLALDGESGHAGARSDRCPIAGRPDLGARTRICFSMPPPSMPAGLGPWRTSRSWWPTASA